MVKYMTTLYTVKSLVLLVENENFLYNNYKGVDSLDINKVINRLIELRKEKALSLEECAKALGIDQKSLRRYEQKTHQVPLPVLMAWMDFLEDTAYDQNTLKEGVIVKVLKPIRAFLDPFHRWFILFYIVYSQALFFFPVYWFGVIMSLLLIGVIIVHGVLTIKRNPENHYVWVRKRSNLTYHFKGHATYRKIDYLGMIILLGVGVMLLMFRYLSAWGGLLYMRQPLYILLLGVHWFYSIYLFAVTVKERLHPNTLTHKEIGPNRNTLRYFLYFLIHFLIYLLINIDASVLTYSKAFVYGLNQVIFILALFFITARMRHFSDSLFSVRDDEA